MLLCYVYGPYRAYLLKEDKLHISLYFQCYREQLHNVRQKAAEEEESHDHLLRELKQQLRDSDNERLAAWDACKQQVRLTESIFLVN